MSTPTQNPDRTEYRPTVAHNRALLNLDSDTYTLLRTTADNLRTQCRITTRSATPDNNWHHYAAAVMHKMGWPPTWHGGDRRKQEAMDNLLKHFAADANRKERRKEDKEAVELMEAFSGALGEEVMDAKTTMVYIKVVKQLRPLLGSGVALKNMLEAVLELVGVVVEKKVALIKKEGGMELTEEQLQAVIKTVMRERAKDLEALKVPGSTDP